MWSEVLARFIQFPAQARVAEVLLERGLKVNAAGIFIDGIRVSNSEIAKQARVDRRAVDQAIATILGDQKLADFFQNLRTFAFLRDVAPILNLGVIVITPRDAAQVGVIEEVAQAIADCKIGIRQAVTDDPYFIDDPKLTLVCDVKIPGSLVDKLLQLNSVKGVSIY